MHEIKVLPVKLSWFKGKYSGLNREPTVPHTVALPIELYYPNIIIIYNKSIYVGAIRTLNSKYQKFMTYLLVDNIYII